MFATSASDEMIGRSVPTAMPSEFTPDLARSNKAYNQLIPSFASDGRMPGDPGFEEDATGSVGEFDGEVLTPHQLTFAEKGSIIEPLFLSTTSSDEGGGIEEIVSNEGEEQAGEPALPKMGEGGLFNHTKLQLQQQQVKTSWLSMLDQAIQVPPLPAATTSILLQYGILDQLLPMASRHQR